LSICDDLTVQLLVEQQGVVVDAQGDEGITLLQVASYSGKDAIVRLLVEKGADDNAQGGKYDSALQAASSQGFETTVRSAPFSRSSRTTLS
jgi:ankyrin repeat protein